MGVNGKPVDPNSYRLVKCRGVGCPGGAGPPFRLETRGALGENRFKAGDCLLLDPKSYLVCVWCGHIFDPAEPEQKEVQEVFTKDPPLDPGACSHKWGSEMLEDGSRVCIRCGDPK